jgi:hypothetical protein
MSRGYSLAAALICLASSAWAAEVKEITGQVVVPFNNKAVVDFSCPDGYEPKGVNSQADRVLAKFDLPTENHTRIYFFNWGTDPSSTITARYSVVCVK